MDDGDNPKLLLYASIMHGVDKDDDDDTHGDCDREYRTKTGSFWGCCITTVFGFDIAWSSPNASNVSFFFYASSQKQVAIILYCINVRHHVAFYSRLSLVSLCLFLQLAIIAHIWVQVKIEPFQVPSL